MMTTLRRDRRTTRTARFNLEPLDDRIVPSAMGAEAAVEGAAASLHPRAAEKALLAHERHEARIARHEMKLARREANLASIQSNVSAVPLYAVPFNGKPPAPAPSTRQGGHVNPQAIVATANPISLAISSTAATTSPTAAAVNHTTMASTDTSSTSNSTTPLPGNVSAPLQSLYQQYEAFESSGGSGTFSPTGVNGLVISGTNVGINVHTNDSTDFDTLLSQLQSDGLQVTTSSATYGIIDGMLPIAQLPVVGQISTSPSVTPMLQPTMN